MQAFKGGEDSISLVGDFEYPGVCVSGKVTIKVTSMATITGLKIYARAR